MVKTGLKIYRDNIWHFFTILGFIALGLIISISIIIPNMSNAITKSAVDLNKAAELISQKIDIEKFCNSIYDQFRAMDWTNPFTTLQKIFTQSNLVKILSEACRMGGVDPKSYEAILPAINSCATTIINTSVTQLQVLITCISVCSIVGYVLIRTIVHVKSTQNKNLIKYIINLISSIILISFIAFLFVVTVRGTSGTGLWLSLIAVTILQVVGELTISFLTYHKKNMKYKDIVNIKTIIGSIVTSGLIVGISFVIVAIIYPFNQLAAVMIAIPLLLVTFIIMDTVTNSFVTNYSKNSIEYFQGAKK